MTYAIMTHDIKCYPFIYISYIYIFFFSDFLIVKCNLQCREQAHFHCCYCSKTVIRKVQIIKHLQVCTKRQVPPTETVETAAIIEPVATRADCVGLGTNCELEATVSNIYTVPLRFACANVILLLGCKLLPFIDMLPCWTEGTLWFRLHLKGYSTLKWKFCHHILTPMLFQSFMNFFLLLNRKEDI